MLFCALASDGTVTWISGAATFLLGRDPQELVGGNVFDFLHPDDVGLVVETMAEAARGSADRIRVPLRVSHGDGRWLSLEFGGLDLRPPDGSGTFLVWGSPHEPTGRLVQYLDSLLAGAALPDLLDEVIAWHDSATLGTRSAIAVREPSGMYRNRARSPDLPEALAIGLDPDEPEGKELLARLGDEEAVSWPTVDALPLALAQHAVSAGFGGLWLVAVRIPHRRDPEALLLMWRRRPGAPFATQRRQLATTAQVLRLGLEWSTNQRELVTAATTDPLTGLANRTQLDARIRGDGSKLAAVLFCDLDDFKQVNDRYGHLVGDRILQETSRRMDSAIRTDDLLVRLGGDEFAVWCPALRSPGDAETVASRLVAALDEPVVIDDHVHHVGCSIGVAIVRADGDLVGDVVRILGAADQALYLAKRAGKGRYAVDRATDRPLPLSF